MKDKNFKEALEIIGKLVILGGNLVSSIEKYGKYSKHGMSPNMKDSVYKWKNYLEEEFNSIIGGDKDGDDGRRNAGEGNDGVQTLEGTDKNIRQSI